MKKNMTLNTILDFLMYIFYALVPIYFMQFAQGPIFNSKILLVLELLILSIWIYIIIFKEKCFYMPNLRSNIYLYLTILVGLIASLFAFYPLNSAITICIIGIGILYYILFFNKFYNDKNFEKLNIYLNINIITSIILIICQILIIITGALKIGDIQINGFYKDYTGYMITSLFANPNTFGMYLTIGLYSCMIKMTIRSGKKLYNTMNIIIFIIGIIMSGSRTALISTALVMFLYIIFVSDMINKAKVIFEKNKKVIMIIFSIVVLLAIIFLLKINFTEIPIFEKFTGGSRGRTEKWIGVWKLIKENNILFGVGNIDSIQDPYYSGLAHTHNAYVNMALRGGLLLLISYLMYILSTFKYIYKNVKKLNTIKLNLVKTMTIIIIGLLTTQMFEMGILFTNVTYFGSIFFMLLMAYIYVVIDKSNNI